MRTGHLKRYKGVFVTWSFEWILLPMISEYNMQHGIFNECFVAQVVLQGLANVQLIEPISDKHKKM